MTAMDRLSKVWNQMVAFFSFEWIMSWKRPNGGGIVLLRALLIASVVYTLVLALIQAIDPNRAWIPDLRELQSQIVEKFPWFGAIFGAAYASLYARFSSQWRYLAELYNSIKQTETSGTAKDAKAIAEWKAGFIEDAQLLHLATKESFVSVIKAWADDKKVKTAFEEHVPGGKIRLDALIEQVGKIYENCSNKY